MTDLAKEIVPVNIEDELKTSYLDYAMSVIVSRALPDVRDGLKPVQRRIIFAMHEQGMFHSKAFVKCAAVVGEVLKKYHPHGDMAVYDTRTGSVRLEGAPEIDIRSKDSAQGLQEAVS